MRVGDHIEFPIPAWSASSDSLRNEGAVKAEIRVRCYQKLPL